MEQRQRGVYSRLPIYPSNPELQKQSSSASDPISIRTDVPTFSRYADIMNSDVPDLSYDYDYSSPHSASSSNMIPTPVFDWTTPLTDDAPDGKAKYSPLLQDWPPSSADHSVSLQSYSSSPSQSHLSSPSASLDCVLDGLDELNWEKQSHNPELSPCFTSTTVVPKNTTSYPINPSLRGTSSQQSKSIIHHTYSASSSTNKDTHGNQPMHFSLSQASSSQSASTCINTISPSVLSSVSSPSPPISSQPPLKLHQPRPSRRIPIISLAELASAGEGLLQPTRRRKQSKTAHASVPYPRSPFEALSPLPLDCHGFSPVSEKREFGHVPATSKMNSYQASLRPSQLPNPPFPTLFRQGNMPAKVITCSCGCMESYTIR